MNTLFLSDTHFDQPSIIKFRTQFSSSEEHDAIIKENYHKVVRPKDTVNFVGDICMTPAAVQELKTWAGVKSIYLGNHDTSEFKKRGVSLAMLQEVFEDRIYGFGRKYGYWIGHCPIHPDELRNRNMIHGHVHSNSINDPRYFNVCMENIDYTPISLEQIRAEFTRRGV